jgi:hypothetical protein
LQLFVLTLSFESRPQNNPKIFMDDLRKQDRDPESSSG